MKLEQVIVSRNDISCLYSKESDAEKAIVCLENKTLLPMGINNPNFADLVFVVGCAYFGGNISDEFLVGFSAEPSLNNTLENIFTKYNMNLNHITHNSYNLRGEGSRPFGRFLHLMGVPLGDKSQQKLEFPTYIKQAIIDGEKSFLKEFTSSLLCSKAYFSKTNRVDMKFSSIKDEFIDGFVTDIQSLLNMYGIHTTQTVCTNRTKTANYSLNINITGGVDALKLHKDLFLFNDEKFNKL